MIKKKPFSLKKANIRRTLRIMRLMIISIMLGAGISMAAGSYSQTANLSLRMKNKSLKEVFSTIEKNSEFIFFYYDNAVDVNKKVSVDVEGKTIYEVLDQLFTDTDNSYSIADRQITISQKEVAKTSSTQQQKKTHRVTGVVVDDLNEELVGVSIRIKERPSVGTATDINGKYLLDVLPNETLEFIYVGYKTQFVPVAGKETIDVMMKMNDEVLEEVTVVGYGVQKKISIIGSQQTITATDVKVPVRNLTNSLAGRVSGVVSVQRSGEPGSDDANVYIRGISTLTAGMSAPLTLVDGVPRTFSDVDPEDIESFSILKDASATAIYGVRGANGVIIIKTKSGSSGKPKFNVRYSEGWTKFTKTPQFIDAPTYMQISNEALLTRGTSARYTQDEINMTRSGADPYLYPNINWLDLLFKDFSRNRTANANISGGSDNAIYYIGLGYYDETGMYDTKSMKDYNSNASYKRYNVTSNITLKPFRTTEIKLGIQGYLANVNYPGASANEIFKRAFTISPNYVAPIYPDGKIGDQPSGALQNPYALLNHTGYANQWRSQVFSNLRLTQQLPFVQGLSATAMFSFDTYNNTSNRFTKKPDTWQAKGRDDLGYLMYEQTSVGDEGLKYANSSQGNRNIYMEAALNYDRSFGEHDVTGMLLFNQSDEIDTKADVVEKALPYRFRGLAGRFTYAFNNRYFGEFNFGYNGSENFMPDKRFGFFPSGGLGWVISNESFFEPLSAAIQHLKIRGTYGKVGNSKINGRRFAYLATVETSKDPVYEFGKNQGESYKSRSIGDYAVDVTWETAYKTNIGLDLMTLDNKLNLQFDVFYDKRESIFLERNSIPGYVGMIKKPLGNLGRVDNKGFDASVNYNNKWGDWSLSLLGNFTFTRNKVKENDIPTSYPWQSQVGYKVGQRFGLVAVGLFESEEDVIASPLQAGDTRPGDIKYKDLNGDGKIDDYDKAPIGWGQIPEIMYGFGFTLSWKDFSLSTLFQGAANVDVMIEGDGLHPFSKGLSSGNILTNIDDRWTEENPSQKVFYPRLTGGSLNMNYESSTWWLKNANYLRLKNLEVSYRIPKSVLKKIYLDDASVFFQGVNLFTLSPFKLWDVELGDMDKDSDKNRPSGAKYPNISSYSIGVNFKF